MELEYHQQVEKFEMLFQAACQCLYVQQSMEELHLQQYLPSVLVLKLVKYTKFLKQKAFTSSTSSVVNGPPY